MSKIKAHIHQIKRKLKKFLSNENFLTFIYKLSHDALFILLSSFTIILIVEGLIPGIITSHLSLLKLSLPLLFVFGGIVLIGSKLNLSYPKIKLSKNKLVPFLIVALFLMIGNSLLQFALWENIVITISTISIFILLYQLLNSD